MQQRAMRFKVLLNMCQDRISKDQAGNLLDQRFHVVATTQELNHSACNFMRLNGDYLRTEGPLSRAMAKWPCHIDRFESQYEKSFTGHRLFGADIVDRIRK